MRTRLERFLLLVLSAPSLAVAQPAPLDRVPIRYVPPTLLVEARVNDSPPLLFAFDTGATTILLDTRVAERLDVRPYAEPPPDRHGAFARLRRLAVGKAVAYDLEVALGDLSELARRLELDLAGILGYTWMEQFIFEIDYASGQLTLWPRQTELSPAAAVLVVPLEIRTGPGFTGAGVFVSGQLEREHSCWFEIDTGTELGILGAAITRQLGLNPNALQPGAAGDASGLRALPRHQVGTLALGGRLFANVTFLVDAARGSDGNPYAQCVMGNEQLQGFVLTLDIPHRRAFFRPAPHVPPRP